MDPATPSLPSRFNDLRFNMNDHPLDRGPVLIASDVHAGAISSSQLEAFLGWLRQARDCAGWIVLNGDLFDFWCEYRRGPSPGHDPLLLELRRTVDAGTPVTLMAGNHDWWGGRFLEEEIGIGYLRRPLELRVGGRGVFVAHGDRCGKGDLAYRMLAPCLRSGPVPRAFRRLEPRIGDRLAKFISRSHRMRDEPAIGELKRGRALRRWALRELDGRPEVDVIVLGHSHVPEAVAAGSGRWYINSGDWVYHRSYVVLGADEPALRQWGGRIE